MKILRLYLATDLHRQSTVIKLDLKKTFKKKQNKIIKNILMTYISVQSVKVCGFSFSVVIFF